MKLKINDEDKIYLKQCLGYFDRLKELIKTSWATKSISLFKKKYLDNINIDDWFEVCKPIKSSLNPIITWIGQSSFLIQINNINILLDPLFYDMNFMYKRTLKPGIDINDLPKIDFILISHNHNDHMNFKSLLKLKKYNSNILIPVGKKRWFDKNGFKNVIENEWWQTNEFNVNGYDTKFTFLPAVHWAGRNIFDINKSLWGSWIIEIDNKIFYFAGDSIYDTHFKRIKEKFNNIDIAFLPIAPCEPHELVSMSHMNAEDAVKSFIDLDAKHFIPMHWGTFRLGLDKFIDPINKLKMAWADKKSLLNDKQLHIIKFGQQLNM